MRLRIGRDVCSVLNLSLVAVTPPNRVCDSSLLRLFRDKLLDVFLVDYCHGKED
jgi:hypothetical protein